MSFCFFGKNRCGMNVCSWCPKQNLYVTCSLVYHRNTFITCYLLPIFILWNIAIHKRHGVSNHGQLDTFHQFVHADNNKNPALLRLWEGNPLQTASGAENVSKSWLLHGTFSRKQHGIHSPDDDGFRDLHWIALIGALLMVDSGLNVRSRGAKRQIRCLCRARCVLMTHKCTGK